MATDPRKLRPSELCRLLNSTPLGEVINERQLHRHRSRAGLRIGDARHVDLLRYTAWLVEQRHTPKPEPAGDPYAALKDRARARNAAIALAGRDIGELPAVVNPERKAQAASSFRYFCDAYFPLTFHLPWSPDHLKVIAKIEQAVLRGGLFAMAMPRGSGKTTICECACIWAVLYGHREFVCLIGSDEGHAMDMLESIKMELDGNDLLLEDFPEVVYPIQALDGIANRCNGQLYKGERTHIGWTAREIVLPTMPDSIASGAIIKVAGITGRIRGMKYKRSDGRTVRPTLVVLDDPQTDESARSLSQCATRESILAGAVLGLSGPGNKISGIMPCTVIRPSDMADNILSREKHPEWNGERTKMVYSFPANEKLWSKYAELRAESLRNGHGGEEATAFYEHNRDAMDEGAVIAWPERFNHDELSAIQHAMNLKLQDEAAFFAEYQNEPLPEATVDADELTADQIGSKFNRMQRAEVPIGCNHLTMFIDVQATLLFYVVAAWEDDFTGYVVDYGTFPDQKRPYFTLRDARSTLTVATKASGLEGAIYSGLESLTREYLGREWRRDDGAMLRIERCLVDANWGSSTDVIYQFCRQSAHAGVVMPSHGRFVGASSQPFSEYKRKPGDRIGHNWRMPNVNGKRSVRHVIFDTNFWKTFVHARLAVPMGDRGCLS
ncbi:MAG: phage terminase large subunit family protein, partial [Planctomycetes bacterium]|nr:phage terminase large subunit family protein [Planctomycetota bacterium]